MPPRLLSALLLLVLPVAARAGPDLPPAPAGRPYVAVHPPKEYAGHAQIWASVQDAQGLRYFGNARSVRVFDGAGWHAVEVPSERYVRALALDPEGTLYAAGDDDFGCIRPDAAGRPAFTSLLGAMPEADRAQAGTFFSAQATSAGVFCSSSKYLVRWSAGRLHWWRLPATRSSNLIVFAGDLYVHLLRVGLFRVRGDELERVGDDPLLSAGLIRTMLPLSDGSRLLLSGSHGLLHWRPGEPVAEWPNPVNALLPDLFPSGAVLLPDGNIAVGTVLAGLLVFSPDGRLQWRLDETSGLPSPSILHLACDRAGTLWLGTGNGVVRVETSVPVHFYGAADGLPRAVIRDLAVHRGQVRAVTSKHLLTLDEAAGRFVTQDLPGESFALVSHPAGLLVTSEDGVLWESAPGQLTRVATINSMVTGLAVSRSDPARVWVAQRNGLNAVRWDGRGWQDEGLVIRHEANCGSVDEDAAGRVWLGTPSRGVACVRFVPPGPERDSLASRATLAVLDVAQGLPKDHGECSVQAVPGGGLLIVTNRGLFEPDAAAERVTPLRRFGDAWADQSHLVGLIAPAGEDEYWFNAAPVLPDGKTGPDAIGRARAGDESWEPLPAFVTDYTGALNSACHDATRARVWFGGSDGLVSIAAGWQPAPHILPALLRRVHAGIDREWLAGATDAGGAVPALAYAERDLRFEFAAPLARPVATVEYAVRLDGLDDRWSDWQREPFKEFTNLPEGRYALHVRARQEGGIGPEAVWAFTVAPPWTRTPLAYALYALAAGGAVLGLLRWRVAAGERERRRLEKLVDDRTAELVVARDEAEAASRAKGAFLASMSHELRTPLHIILGYARVLGRNPALDETARIQLASLGASGEHLLRLVNEVLDLAKVEAGKLQLRPGPCDLPRLLATLAGLFRPQAGDKGLEFHSLLDPGLPVSVVTDEQKLAQVLFNLLGNAVKFTARGRIELQAAPVAGNQVRFAVRDTGPGLAPADQGRLFEPFAQTPAGAAAGGTGLGLVLSARLVALLGGTLELESIPGEGSCFFFTLSLPAAPTVPRADARPVIGHDGPPRCVLVVDDHPANRDILGRQLASAGLLVRTAANGAEALQAHAAEPADLVLLDLRMAPMDGFALARALRAAPNGNRLRLLALSASIFDDEEAKAVAAGCDAFLPKPCAEETLFETIGRLLGLAWHRAGETAATIVTAPPAAVVAGLRDLAERGAIVRLQTRLVELRVADPGLAAWCDEVAALAASYQLERLRARLREPSLPS